MAKAALTPTLYEQMKNPIPMPLEIGCDLVDRLAPMDLTETPMWFVNLVLDRIANTGKHIDDLTVGELRKIINECRVGSNAAAKRKILWWGVNNFNKLKV